MLSTGTTDSSGQITILITLLQYFYYREAAKLRYLSEEKQFSYYHDIMSEYFLGTYGGGKPKPFKYTEIQRQR